MQKGGNAGKYGGLNHELDMDALYFRSQKCHEFVANLDYYLALKKFPWVVASLRHLME